jgi:hypothetical protein
VFSDSELQRFLGIGDDKSLITSAKVMQEISAAARDRIGHINALLSTSRFSLDVPLVFNHILEKVRSRADIMSAVLEVRESREARAFRQQMAYLDEATEIGDDQVIFEIVQEMRDKVDSLRRKIDQPTVGFQVSFPLAVGLDPFGLWKLIKNRRKRHLTFIDQLYSSAAAARPIQLRLGRLRE